MKAPRFSLAAQVLTSVIGAALVAPAAAIFALNLQRLVHFGDPGVWVLIATLGTVALVLPSNWTKRDIAIRAGAIVGLSMMAGFLFVDPTVDSWGWIPVLGAMAAAHPGVRLQRHNRRSSIAVLVALALALLVSVSAIMALLQGPMRTETSLVTAFAACIGAGMAMAGHIRIQPRPLLAAQTATRSAAPIAGRFAEAWAAVEHQAQSVQVALDTLRRLSPSGAGEADRIARELDTTLGDARASIQRWSCVSEAREQAQKFEQRLAAAAERLANEEEPLVRRELAVLCSRYRAAADAAHSHSRDERATRIRLEQLVAALETLALSIERSIAAGRPIEPGAIDDAIDAMTIVSEIANQTAAASAAAFTHPLSSSESTTEGTSRAVSRPIEAQTA